MQITANNLRLLTTAVNAAYTNGFGGVEPTWQRVATLVPSTAAVEHYAWFGQFAMLQEWIGARQIERMKAHDYSIKNKKFQGSQAIERDFIEDNTYGTLMPLFESMGYAAATHPDELVYALMAAGFDTPCYDGQNFFDTDHPVGEGSNETSVSNMQAGSGEPWFLLDTRRPLKPLIFQKRRDYKLDSKTDPGTSDHVHIHDEYLYSVDARVNAGFGFWQMAFGSKAELNDTNFDAAYAAMGAFKSDKGRPLGVMPNLLVVGPSNRAAAKKVIEAENKAQGESNTNYKAVEVLVVPWLE